MELAVSKIGQKVCHCFVLRYKNIKIVNSVQVQVARTREGVNIPSSPEPAKEDLESLPMSPLSGFIWIDWNPWQAHSLIWISFILCMLF